MRKESSSVICFGGVSCITGDVSIPWHTCATSRACRPAEPPVPSPSTRASATPSSEVDLWLMVPLPLPVPPHVPLRAPDCADESIACTSAVAYSCISWLNDPPLNPLRRATTSPAVSRPCYSSSLDVVLPMPGSIPTCRGSTIGATAAGNTTHCLLGFRSPAASFAANLLVPTPAQVVKPVNRRIRHLRHAITQAN